MVPSSLETSFIQAPFRAFSAFLREWEPLKVVDYTWTLTGWTCLLCVTMIVHTLDLYARRIARMS